MNPLLIKYAPHLLVLIALLGGGWYYGHTRYVAGENHVQEQWAVAIAKAEQAAREKEQADAAAAKEIQDALQAKLDTATADARGLARRLRDYQARRCLQLAAGAAPVADPAPGESGDSGNPESAVDAALESHLAACGRDAERLAGWQNWWKAVQ